MYKTIKIPEQTYNDFVKLKKILEKQKVFKGLHALKLNHVVGYAAHRVLDQFERENKFKQAAGSWVDLNTDAILSEIYESRKIKSRAFFP